MTANISNSIGVRDNDVAEPSALLQQSASDGSHEQHHWQPLSSFEPMEQALPMVEEPLKHQQEATTNASTTLLKQDLQSAVAPVSEERSPNLLGRPAEQVEATEEPEEKPQGVYYIKYDEHDFPETLLDWRRELVDETGTIGYHWFRMRAFFLRHGYDLFNSASLPDSPGFKPRRKGEERAPDAFHATVPTGTPCDDFRVLVRTKKCWPATRISDGTHVMMKLLVKGHEGLAELHIYRRFSRPDISQHADNHVLPLLDELVLYDMVFGIFPLLQENIVTPWFFNLAEATEAVSQSFKGLAFMHSHFVAHLDIGSHDILMNFGGERGQKEYNAACKDERPFRSLLATPCRYTFIDFEYGVCFPPGADASEMRMDGMPILDSGRIYKAEQYGKHLPPEWLLPGERCPFKSDVFQIGQFWHYYLWDLRFVLPVLFIVLNMMTCEDPEKRISMAYATAFMQEYRQTLHAELLQIPLWPYRQE